MDRPEKSELERMAQLGFDAWCRELHPGGHEFEWSTLTPAYKDAWMAAALAVWKQTRRMERH